MVENVIRNQNNAEHYMSIQPVGRTVKIFTGDTLLMETQGAMWLQEIAKAVYPPMIYVPKSDLAQKLDPVDKTTHCPLKGDASYHSYNGQEIAWSYDLPLGDANDLADMLCFWPDRVRIEIG